MTVLQLLQGIINSNLSFLYDCSTTVLRLFYNCRRETVADEF